VAIAFFLQENAHKIDLKVVIQARDARDPPIRFSLFIQPMNNFFVVPSSPHITV
jgi:hypothetical protein